MQLGKKRPSLSRALATATGTLLATTAAVNANAAVEEDIGWEFNTSILYYGEQDGRVKDTSGAFDASRVWEDGRQLRVGITLDSLTGATPTGAAPSNQPQTFTRPSGRGSYTTPAGEIPLDDTFKDSRTAGYLNWTQPFGEDWKASIGLSFSDEYDYSHMGGNGSLSREFDNGNRTLSVGFAYASDEWDPEGGIPIPLSEMLGGSRRGNDDDDDDDDSDDDDDNRMQANKIDETRDRTVLDLLVGFTQIIDERTIAQVSYSYSRSEDYLNDPFKFLSVLDPQGDLVPGPDGLNSYRFENRPDERTKHSIFTSVKRYVGGGALGASYRFMTDDWGIDSHTLDVRYRWNLSARNYLEPHARLYLQSEADFFQANLTTANPTPEFASADYRLGKFTGTTFGLKLGHRMKNGSELSARAEWYAQNGTSKLEGVARNENVFPDLDAYVFQLSYRFHLSSLWKW